MFNECPFLFNSPHSSERIISANSIKSIFPVLGYKHSDVNNNVSAPICGGYFCQSMADPCMYGRYLNAFCMAVLFGQLLKHQLMVGSGNFPPVVLITLLFIKSTPESSQPDLGYISSFGQDNRKDVFILAASAVCTEWFDQVAAIILAQRKFLTFS